MPSHSVYLSVAVGSSLQVNMSSRILVILAILSVIECAPAVNKARQYLPALPGFVPVYIRSGDTPLEDINPDLAEAFNSYAQKHARLSFGRASDGKILHIDDVKDNISNVEDLDLEEQNAVSASEKPDLIEPHHIQKIPRD